MVVLRCTHKLLARLKVDDTSAAGSTTRLGDWYGNVLRLGRRQMLLFISEHSRLPVVLPIADGKRLATVLPDAVARALADIGISRAEIEEERSQMSPMVFGRTTNRSLLGTLTDFAIMAKGGVWYGQEPESPEELMRFLARTPILPLKGERPIELTKNVFRER